MLLTTYSFNENIRPLNEIIKTLESEDGRRLFKQNKIKVAPLHKKENRVYTQCYYKDTTLTNIKVTPDLYVIDCDNLYSFDYIYNLTINFNCETLTTKTPYGGHFFFKRNGEATLPSVLENSRVGIASIKASYKDPLDYYSQSKTLNIEFFTSDNHSEQPVIDGNANAYYKQYSTHNRIISMPSDFFIALSDLAYSYNDLAPSFKARANAKDKEFRPSKKRAEAIFQWLKNGNIPMLEFALLYDPQGLKNFDFNNLYPRNNTLNKIAYWAGSCGYLDEFTWEAFVTLFYNQYFLPLNAYDSPFTLDEVKRTILIKGKFNKLFYTPEESDLKLKEPISQADYSKSVVLSTKPFFALNTDSTAVNEILLIEVDNNSLKITQRSEKAAETKAMSDPYLYDEYIEAFVSPEGKKVKRFAKEKLFYLKVKSSFGYFVKSLYSFYSVAGISNVEMDISYFKQNNKIQKIKDDFNEIADKEAELAKIKADFENTYSNFIIKNNLIMDNDIRAKFYGDLGIFIQNRTLLNSMLILRGDGGTGKDKTLAPFISTAIFGAKQDFTKDISMQDDKYILLNIQLDNAMTISPELITSSHFNDVMTNRCLIFSELGGGNRYRPGDFLETMKLYIAGNSYIPIHKKGKDVYNEYNDKYFIWLTNYDKEIMKKDDKIINRRFYFSWSKKNINISNENIRRKAYKALGYNLADIDFTSELSEIWSVFKLDEIKILKYLVLYAPQDALYCGYSIIPESAMDADLFDDEVADFVSLSGENETSALELVKLALDTFISYKGELLYNNTLRIANNETDPLNSIAKVFLAILSYQSQNQKHKENFTKYHIPGKYYIVKDISDLILDIPQIKNISLNKQNAKKWLNSTLKSRLTSIRQNDSDKKAVATTSSKIQLRGIRYDN